MGSEDPQLSPVPSLEPLPEPDNGTGSPAETALNAIASLFMAVAGTQMVVLIVIFAWLVFGRYVLNDTPTWVEQLSLLLVVWIVFLGAAVGVWRGTHLGVDFIRDALPDIPRRILEIVSIILLMVFGIFMAKQGATLALSTWTRQIPMLNIAEGWRAVPLSLSGAMIVVFSFYHLISALRSRTLSASGSGEG